jgi:hypothetical protein
VNHRRLVPCGDLVRVINPTPVECLGGPNDGEFRHADENGRRPNGLYVVINELRADGEWRVVAHQYVPEAE